MDSYHQSPLHLLLLLCLQAAFSIPLPENALEDHDSRAVQAINTLQSTWYNHSTGLWANMWWNSANCLTTIAGYHGTEPPDTSFIDSAANIYETTFQGGLNLAEHLTNKTPGSWTNDFYDDEAWWALAWIQVYDVTSNTTYLEASRAIYRDMKAGLNQNSCGGLPWQRHRDTHSSIENALFLDTAAKLAVRVPKAGNGDDYLYDYLSDAIEQYNWFINQSHLLSTDGPSTNLILDNLNETACAPTNNNNYYLWTYNQGATIGALVSLAAAHPKSGETYLDLADTIADAAITHFSQGGSLPPELNDDDSEAGSKERNARVGVLTEPCDPRCDGNTAQFKGVLVRGLAQLQLVRPREEIRAFIDRNAMSIWQRARGGEGEQIEGRLGSDWVGPYSGVDGRGQDVSASAMCSGLDGLVAAAVVGRVE